MSVIDKRDGLAFCESRRMQVEHPEKDAEYHRFVVENFIARCSLLVGETSEKVLADLDRSLFGPPRQE